jgi:NADPH:quinone reductase-like Zn-dependent oxidoreductase
VCAASVNDWDWSLVRGKPFYIRLLCGFFRPKIRIPGVDIAGTVESVGRAVTTLRPGDAVYGDLSESGFGGFAEYVCAPEAALSPKPEKMSFVEAAALPHAAMLALQGLRKAGQLQRNQKVLINGAGGGVGTLGVQIAHAMDARDITGVDHADKFSMMQSAGFQHMIDYTREDFTKLDQRYDLILDTKTNRPISNYLRALSPTGVYVTVGGDTKRLLQAVSVAPLIRRIGKKNVHLLALKPNEGMNDINALYDRGALKPVIDGPYDFNDLPKAIQHFGDGRHLGKVVVNIS